jgi:hypothetical protein
MVSARARRRRAIELLVATDHARDRLARATFEIVAEGLDLGPIAIRTSPDRAWVRAAIAGPIQAAAEHAILRLVDQLETSLAGGPPELVDRILAAAAPDDVDNEEPFTATADRIRASFRRGSVVISDPDPVLDPAAEVAPLVAVFR